MNIWKKLDGRYGNSGIWQFVKFNLVSMSVSLLQVLLANLLPLAFDGVTGKLPSFLRGIFDPQTLFDKESRYVVDGVTTWGYVLPFFLSNLIANIYGYFINMRKTFRGKGTGKGAALYIGTLCVLILFSTWLQGRITAFFAQTPFKLLARTLAASASGMVQLAVLFPLEKYVIFGEKEDEQG